MFRRSRNDESTALNLIPVKANLVLKIVLCVLLVIGLRIWHLSIIQHEKKKQEAFLPRRKVFIEPALRGTVRDRFNEVLAANRLEYRLSIVYSHFRDIPAWIWAQDGESGKKIRRPLRREYIHKLSQLVAEIIQVDPNRLEDVIHSHGSLNNAIPLVLKKGLSEEQYFRLKALEKDWPGIQVQLASKRYYPKGKVACHVVGYLGPISRERYNSLVSEITTLSDYVTSYESGLDPELPPGIGSFLDAKARLLELEEKAYSINDSVGMLGVEASFDEELRGYCGKKFCFSDARGNTLRELPGATKATSGKRLLLSISSELQEYAEELLAKNESLRPDSKINSKAKKQKMPVMRGGAIVAMDPKNGQVLALASYPRFDPNDFIRAKSAFFDGESAQGVARWIESDSFLERVWDAKEELTRELFDTGYVEERMALSWNKFLELLLPLDSALHQKLKSSTPISELVLLQRDFFSLYNAYPGMDLEALVQLDALKVWFDGLDTTAEKLLYVDLSRLILWHEDFSDRLVSAMGALSIDEFRGYATRYRSHIQLLQKQVKRIWQEKLFSAWRKENEKEFIKEKRRQERALKQYARPYLEYIDREEERQFTQFWQTAFQTIVHSLPFDQPFDKQEAIEFLRALKGYRDCTFPLLVPYSGLSARQKEPDGRDLIYTAVKVYSPGFCRSLAFRHSAIQGSLFKIVTAYAGLKQLYIEKEGAVRQHDMSLFTIRDAVFTQNGTTCVGYFASGKPIPQIYKGGRIPKSLSRNIGPLDLLRALETSSNPYFSLLAAEYLKDPNELIVAARDFGLGAATGIRFDLEARGKVPEDVCENKTGLYSLAIGQHTLLTTPLQTANMLSALANGGALLEPNIGHMLIGKDPPFETKTLARHPRFAYKESLALIGVDFPLFLKAAEGSSENSVDITQTKCIRSIFLPKEVRATLLEALRRVMGRIKSVSDMQNELVGKTSTAESQERIGLGLGRPTTIYNHTWFGGISYPRPQTTPFVFEDPELVVAVYLRYGSYGKEVAPIAAKVVKKWRLIRQAHGL